MPKKFVIICFLNFLLAALLGLLLRYAAINPVALNYRYITHAHSHVAMLGWVYLMLYVFIVHYFIPNKKRVFINLFWLTEIAVIGMLVSFPFQGYGAVSISFSTLHILCSYYFAFLVFKHCKTENKPSKMLLKTALVFMLLSTLGVWCLGPAVSMQGKASAFYQIAIQFFLHFQFNGWFLVGVLAILFHILKVELSKTFKWFYVFLVLSIITTIALPVYWYTLKGLLLFSNGVGVIAQIVALVLALKLVRLKRSKSKLIILKPVVYMYCFATVCLVLKIVLQLLTILPEVSVAAFKYHHFVIGFIHLLMLGVISGFLIAFTIFNNWIKVGRALSFSVFIFILGFLFTETLIVLQGACFYFKIGEITHYRVLLFLGSCLLPLAISGILFTVFKKAFVTNFN